MEATEIAQRQGNPFGDLWILLVSQPMPKGRHPPLDLGARQFQPAEIRCRSEGRVRLGQNDTGIADQRLWADQARLR